MAKFKLDRAGLVEVLKSGEVAEVVGSYADRVAGMVNAPAHDGPADVDSYDYNGGDRAASAVTIAHPGGLGMEARHGYLTRAAAAAGLEVTEGGDNLVDYVTKAGKKRRVTAKQAANWGRNKK